MSTRVAIAHRSIVFAIVATATAVPALAGGLYLYEVSATDIGLASAGWTARAADASTIFKNPAGMARLDGDLLIALQPLYIDSSLTPDPVLTTVDGSDGDASGWTPVGGAYWVTSVSDKVNFGLAAGGYFGLAMEYEDDWVGRYYVQRVQMQALTLEPAVSFRVSDRWSVGLGLALHYGILQQRAAVNNTPLILPVPTPDGSLEVDTHAWAGQVNLGVLWEPSASTRLGLQYLSQATLDFETTPEFTDLRPGLELALDAAGLLGTEIDLSLRLPQAVRVGAYHDLGRRWAVMGDAGWEQWSRFGKVDLVVATDPPATLTADRQYEDVWHAGLGARRAFSGPWSLMFGASYDSSIVEDELRTPDLPQGASLRLGVGAERQMGERSQIAFAYEYVAGGDLSMDVERGPLSGRVAGEYQGAALHFFAVSWHRGPRS